MLKKGKEELLNMFNLPLTHFPLHLHLIAVSIKMQKHKILLLL